MVSLMGTSTLCVLHFYFVYLFRSFDFIMYLEKYSAEVENRMPEISGS